MNSETGQIYRSAEEIRQAHQRKEPLQVCTIGFAEWLEKQPEANSRKVAQKLAAIRRCQPHLSLVKAQNLARKAVVL